MQDNEIISLFNARNEKAIDETARKYGGYLHTIAFGVLGNREDSEECLNDTYHRAWNLIPPQIPVCLTAFLGRITRNLAISKYRTEHAAKRYNGASVMLSELEECIPDKSDTWGTVENGLISDAISDWLKSLNEADRQLFVRRYWYCLSSAELAASEGTTANNVNVRLCRLRKCLKEYLEKEEFL